jgi:hypothetical protein
MADSIVSLLDSSESRTTLGAAARRKVTERHDINRTAPRILEIMERTLCAGEATR